ncbi:MAG: FAD-dependent oxidoreductase, partial [bacterium]
RSYSLGFYPWELASRQELEQFFDFHRDMYRWSRWRDSLGRPAFQLPIVYATDAEEVTALDAITLADYVYGKGWDSPLLHHFLDNRMTDEYGCLADEISAYAGILYWAFEAGEEKAPPGASQQAPVISWPEGNSHLVRGLARTLPRGAVRTDAWVVSLRNHADEVHAMVLDPRGTTRTFRGRQCIFAAPKLRAELLIPELEEAGRREHRLLEYSPWLVANLLLSECPEHDAQALAWDNLIYRSWSLGFINGQHFRTPGKDSDRPFLLTFYACFSGSMREPARRDLLELDWDSWARLIAGELERPLPDVRKRIERMDIRRWGHAMVRPAPGLIWGGTREALGRPLGNIHFAGNDAGILPLYEEAVYQGVSAAEAVLTRLGRPFRSLIEPEHERLD